MDVKFSLPSRPLLPWFVPAEPHPDHRHPNWIGRAGEKVVGALSLSHGSDSRIVPCARIRMTPRTDLRAVDG